MKTKITNKELKNGYYYLIRAGYCELQHLLKYGTLAKERFFNSGVYGWNYDVYEIEGKSGTLAICTGYRNMQGERVEGMKKYEDKARKLFNFGTGKTWEQQRKDANRYQKQFYNFIIKQLDKKRGD